MVVQEESSGLVINLSQMQFVLWLVVGIAIMLYTLFNIRSQGSPTVSGKNLILLVVSVIILFVLIRNIYKTGSL